MLNSSCAEKVKKYIDKFSRCRDIALLGQSDKAVAMLTEMGHKKIHVFSESIIESGDDVHPRTDLRENKEKYYVVAVSLVVDHKKSTSDLLYDYGYEEYRDFVIIPDDEFDELINNINKFSQNRKIVLYGFSQKLERILLDNEIEIYKKLSATGDDEYKKIHGLEDANLISGKRSEYYLVFASVFKDNGEWQNWLMWKYGFLLRTDYCFFSRINPQDRINEEIWDNFYLLEKNKKHWYNTFTNACLSERKLDVNHVENGVILPIKMINNYPCGGVCDRNFNFVAGHKYKSEDGKIRRRYIYKGYDVAEGELCECNETVIFGGIMFDHPGHLIFESIAERLWWVVENPDCNYRIAIVVTWGNGRFVSEFLELLKIPSKRVIFVDKPTRFTEIIVPDQSIIPLMTDIPYDYTKEYINFFDYIKKHLVPGNYKKIYLTKSKTNKGNIWGEDFLIEFFKKRGFEIINPEDYSILQKAAIVYGADEMATLDGTNAIYSIFCKSSVHLTVFSRMKEQCVGCMGMVINSARIQNYVCVDTSLDFLTNNYAFGLHLIGPTNNFINYVKNVYNEDFETSDKNYLKTYLFDYLIYFIKYYADPDRFNCIKNLKIITVFQKMSEVFLGKEFDTSKLDLTTNEDVLQGRIKQLTADMNNTKRCIGGLENTDVYKTAKLLEATNSRHEKQMAEILIALQNMQNLQLKIDELSKENTELTKSLLSSEYALELQKRDSKLTETQLQNDLISAKKTNKALSIQLEEIKSINAEAESSVNDLRNQIINYEHSNSWRITRPLRSIAWFFRRLFGKTK